MENDGTIKIGVDLNEKQLQTKIERLKKNIEKIEKKNKPKLEFDIKNAEKDLDILGEKAETQLYKITEKQKKLDEMQFYGKQNTPQYAKAQNELSAMDTKYGEITNKIEKQEDKIDFQKSQLKDINATLELEKTELNSLINQQDIINEGKKKEKKNEEDINEEQNKHGEGLNKLVKKVGKLALGVFGLRSAYAFVRQAVGVLSNENKDIANDITNIKSALANTMLPVVQWLINGVKTLLQYINYIWRKLGHTTDLFKSNAKATKETAKNLNKELASFDEINKLGSEDSGDTTGTDAFNMDISGENFEAPKWLEELTEGFVGFFKAVKTVWDFLSGNLGVVGAVAVAFLTVVGVLKLINFLLGGSGGLSQTLMAIGILLIGVGATIYSFATLLQTMSDTGTSVWEVFGLMLAILVPLTASIVAMALAVKSMGVTEIVALVVILGGLVLIMNSLKDLIVAITKSGQKAENVASAVAVVMLSLVALVGTLTLSAIALSSNPLALLGVLALMTAISVILEVVKDTLPTILDAVGDFIQKIAPYLLVAIGLIQDGINTLISTLGEVLPPIIREVGNLFTKIFNGISNVVNTVGGNIRSILNTVKSLVVTVLDSIMKFIYNAGPAINVFVDNVIKAVTKLINFLISGIEYMINTLVIGGLNTLIRGINSIGKYVGFTIPTQKDMSIPRFVPRLASGGIVDVPRTGVGLGNAIVGEKGREGVLPLTNSSTMTELGKEIAKWIPINLDITNTIDGRVLNKRLETIRNNNTFARNGG